MFARTPVVIKKTIALMALALLQGGAIWSGCGPSNCSPCRPGTHASDPTQSCSGCISNTDAGDAEPEVATPSTAAAVATRVARFFRAREPYGGAALHSGSVPPQKGHAGSQTRWCWLQCGQGSS